MRKPWKLATTIATLPVLGACGGDGGPRDVVETDLLLERMTEAREAAAFRNTLREMPIPEPWRQYPGNWALRQEASEGLRDQAFREMLQMPPEEFRAFHLRNGWKERWPELWGPDIPGPVRLAGPPSAPDRARLRAVFDRMLAAIDEDGLWEYIFGTRAEAEKWYADEIERMERHLAEYIEEHARRWPNAESMWRPGQPGNPGGAAWVPEWVVGTTPIPVPSRRQERPSDPPTPRK